MEKELKWRDLPCDDVWDIAHAEHRTRVNVSSDLGQVAFMSNPLEDSRRWTSDNTKAWDTLLLNEKEAQIWFRETASERHLVPAAAETPLLIDYLAWWIKTELETLPGINQSVLFAEAGVGSNYMHLLTMPYSKPASLDKVWKISNASKRIRIGLSRFSENIASS
ncbi:MAG TPA: hypothetical protein VIH90_07555 [Candidatus Saccharimonadales bacterium]